MNFGGTINARNFLTCWATLANCVFQIMRRSATLRRAIVAKYCWMTRRRAPRTLSPATPACPGARASALLRAAYSPFVVSAPPANSAGWERRHPETAVTCTSVCSPKVTSISLSKLLDRNAISQRTTWRLPRANSSLLQWALYLLPWRRSVRPHPS
jgi:hypothetical protein